MSPGARVPRKVGLSLQLILDEAVRLVEEEGPRALSMRALARRLDVEAMSLYRYVASHEKLLDAVVDRVVDRMLARPELRSDDGEDWRAFVTRQAHGVRSIATELPGVFPLIATHPPSAPWIRPPLRSLRWIEEFLAGLLSRGFAEDGAAVAYRVFTSFLLGNLLLEVQARGVQTGPVDEGVGADPPGRAPCGGAGEPAGEPADPDLADYPAVSALAPQLSESDPDAEFQAALTSLLDRMEHLNGLPSPTSLG